MKDELDIFPTDKCQRFLQIAIIILGVCCMWPGMPKSPKVTILLFLYNILKERTE